MVRIRCLILLLFALTQSPVQSAEGTKDVCVPEGVEGVEVEWAGAGHSFLSRDGRTYFLSDVYSPQSHQENEGAGHLPVGGPYIAYPLSDKPDRWGELPAVVVGQGGYTVNKSVILAGQSFVFYVGLNTECQTALLEAERLARLEQRGLWQTYSPYDAEDATLLKRYGEYHLVEGTVLSVGHTRKVIYLNFSERWTQDFTGIIQRENVEAFARSGIDVDALEGQFVRLRGVVQLRRGPEILLEHAAQLEVLQPESLN
ncbi:hypothetical protein E1162_06380 [Rhodobacteraceae bacterium RKSG542]|nr:hypothetical protein [Pseudovibrio flavus]